MLGSGLLSSMRQTRRTFLGAVTATVALSGCLGDEGGSGDSTPAPEPTDSPTTTEASTASPTSSPAATATGDTSPTVQVRSHPDLGEILVGPDELTLYMFDSDTRGDPASTCYDSCADAWPPLVVDGDPTPGEGVTAALSTFEREGEGTQVAANGWPLYYFASDESPGDANGQGVNDVWWVLRPDGAPVVPESTTASSGGGGY